MKKIVKFKKPGQPTEVFLVSRIEYKPFGEHIVADLYAGDDSMFSRRKDTFGKMVSKVRVAILSNYDNPVEGIYRLFETECDMPYRVLDLAKPSLKPAKEVLLECAEEAVYNNHKDTDTGLHGGKKFSSVVFSKVYYSYDAVPENIDISSLSDHSDETFEDMLALMAMQSTEAIEDELSGPFRGIGSNQVKMTGGFDSSNEQDTDMADGDKSLDEEQDTEPDEGFDEEPDESPDEGFDEGFDEELDTELGEDENLDEELEDIWGGTSANGSEEEDNEDIRGTRLIFEFLPDEDDEEEDTPESDYHKSALLFVDPREYERLAEFERYLRKRDEYLDLISELYSLFEQEPKKHNNKSKNKKKKGKK